jgi:hypothetical protein
MAALLLYALYGAFFVKVSILAPLLFFVVVCGVYGLRDNQRGNPPSQRGGWPRYSLVFGSLSCEAHHDAIIRIVGEAPQKRSHSIARRSNAMARIGLTPPRIVIASPPGRRRGGRDEFRLRLD